MIYVSNNTSQAVLLICRIRETDLSLTGIPFWLPEGGNRIGAVFDKARRSDLNETV
jgi:hypothetical protein